MIALPTVRSTIERRVLVNYQVDPDIVTGVLPGSLQPRLISGRAIGGICLIRLSHLRPSQLPSWFGVRSENAAHRIAVEWNDGGDHGVYVPRRDTTSRLSTLIGGRLFPGRHHHATFRVREGHGTFQINFTSDDGTTHVAIDAIRTATMPAASVFASLHEASQFFRQDSIGYSDSTDGDELEGIELAPRSWNLAPLDVSSVHSSYFEDTDRFPRGSVTFDSAFVMHHITADWHRRPSLDARAYAPTRRRK